MSRVVISARVKANITGYRFATIPKTDSSVCSAVSSSVSLKTVHCFVDYSNLFVNARKLAAEMSERVLPGGELRIEFGNLRTLAQRNHRWGSGYSAAGLDHGESIRQESQRAGIEFDVYERGKATNTEQGIDEIIQCRMYKLANQQGDNQVVVLFTGDGNGHGRGEGFLPALQALRSRGFEVEVLSWKDCLNATLRHWAEQHGQVLELNRFFKALTYEPGRRALCKQAFGKSLLGMI